MAFTRKAFVMIQRVKKQQRRAERERIKKSVEEVSGEEAQAAFCATQTRMLNKSLTKLVGGLGLSKNPFVDKAAARVLFAAEDYFSQGASLKDMNRRPELYPRYKEALLVLKEHVESQEAKRHK